MRIEPLPQCKHWITSPTHPSANAPDSVLINIIGDFGPAVWLVIDCVNTHGAAAIRSSNLVQYIIAPPPRRWSLFKSVTPDAERQVAKILPSTIQRGPILYRHSHVVCLNLYPLALSAMLLKYYHKQYIGGHSQWLLANHYGQPPSTLRLSNIGLGLYLDGWPSWYVNFCW